MTLKEAKKLTSKRDLIYWRAGADTIITLSVREANKLLATYALSDDTLDELRFTEFYDILYIDEQSWVEYHENH